MMSDKKLAGYWQRKYCEEVAKVEVLKAWMEKKESIRSIVCAYCDWEVSKVTLKELREHIEHCVFHPMHKLKQELAEMKKKLQQYKDE